MTNSKVSEQTQEARYKKLRAKTLDKEVTVDVVACSSVVPPIELKRGLNKLTELGFAYRLGSNLSYQSFAYAGTIEERAIAFYQAAKADSQIIWAVRGGYGAAQLLTHLQRLSKEQGLPKKKLLIGYSDLTALYQFVSEQWGWDILHASMVSSKDFQSINDRDQSALIQFIENRSGVARWQGKSLNCISKASLDSKSVISGQLYGGNLAVICSLIGTPWQLELSGKILFIEEIGESWCKIDRMLLQLYLAGCLTHCKAIVLGQFIHCRDTSPKGVLTEQSSELVDLRTPLSESEGLELVFYEFSNLCKLPIFSGLPVGHIEQNAPLPLLAHYELSIKNGLVFKHWGRELS